MDSPPPPLHEGNNSFVEVEVEVEGRGENEMRSSSFEIDARSGEDRHANGTAD